MNAPRTIRRPLAIAMLAVLVSSAVAPTAEASHRNRRYRGHAVERRVVVQPRVREVRAYRPVPRGSYTVWRSSRGPVFAGFLGGLFLGATLSNAAPDGFVYWDPYCHRGFASLDLYYQHCGGHRHARTIQVVEVADGHDWRDADCDDGGGWDDEDHD